MIIRGNFCKFCIKTYVVTPSSEPSPREGLHKGSQHMALKRNKKKFIPQLSSNTPSYMYLAL